MQGDSGYKATIQASDAPDLKKGGKKAANDSDDDSVMDDYGQGFGKI